jgi:hypothetical protein
MFSSLRKSFPHRHPLPFGVFLFLTVTYLPAQLTAQLEYLAQAVQVAFSVPVQQPSQAIYLASVRPRQYSILAAPTQRRRPPCRYGILAVPAELTPPSLPGLMTSQSPPPPTSTPATPVRVYSLPHMFTEYRERPGEAGEFLC